MRIFVCLCPRSRLNTKNSNMADKLLVLIVEDDPLQRMMAGDIVEDAGFEPLYAANADQAMTILETREDVRILLTDVDMPGSMDGLKLAEVVNDRWPPIQIMVVSGHVLPEETNLPTRSRFINKPYAPDRVITALKMLAFV
jgi:two-component system, response regulator PdtaR